MTSGCVGPIHETYPSFYWTKANHHVVFSRCAQQHRNYTNCRDEVLHRITSAESRFLEIISEKVTCLRECTEQEAELRVCLQLTHNLLLTSVLWNPGKAAPCSSGSVRGDGGSAGTSAAAEGVVPRTELSWSQGGCRDLRLQTGVRFVALHPEADGTEPTEGHRVAQHHGQCE